MMQSGGKNTVLEIKNLSVSFHSGPESVTAVNQLSLSIGKGESIGLVGESGSGKSVTALSVMRLLDNAPSHAATGVIEFTDSEGQTTDLRSLPEKEMRLLRGSRIGISSQFQGLLSHIAKRVTRAFCYQTALGPKLPQI